MVTDNGERKEVRIQTKKQKYNETNYKKEGGRKSIIRKTKTGILKEKEQVKQKLETQTKNRKKLNK